MEPINPMFQKKNHGIIKTPSHSINVRKNPNTNTKSRKTRSDKKNDIKIPLLLQQRQLLKYLAKKKRMVATPYCSFILTKALLLDVDFPEVEYLPSEKTIHAKLNNNEYDLLSDQSIKWDCSIREAAHRMIMEMIRIESEGIRFESIQQT